MKETVNYIITFGTLPGYNVDNNMKKQMDQISELIQSLIKRVHQETNIYVSGILSEGKAIYSLEFGCPSRGEDIYQFSISFNPEFIDINESPVEEAVILLANYLKEELSQETMSIEKKKSEYFYLKNSKIG